MPPFCPRVEKRSTAVTGVVTSDDNPIGVQEIKKHFDKPIIHAAAELKISVSSLHKRCKELGMKNWPFRKITSLKSRLINISSRVQQKSKSRNLAQMVLLLEKKEAIQKELRECYEENLPSIAPLFEEPSSLSTNIEPSMHGSFMFPSCGIHDIIASPDKISNCTESIIHTKSNGNQQDRSRQYQERISHEQEVPLTRQKTPKSETWGHFKMDKGYKEPQSHLPSIPYFTKWRYKPIRKSDTKLHRNPTDKHIQKISSFSNELEESNRTLEGDITSKSHVTMNDTSSFGGTPICFPPKLNTKTLDSIRYYKHSEAFLIPKQCTNLSYPVPHQNQHVNEEDSSSRNHHFMRHIENPIHDGVPLRRIGIGSVSNEAILFGQNHSNLPSLRQLGLDAPLHPNQMNIQMLPPVRPFP